MIRILSVVVVALAVAMAVDVAVAEEGTPVEPQSDVSAEPQQMPQHLPEATFQSDPVPMPPAMPHATMPQHMMPAQPFGQMAPQMPQHMPPSQDNPNEFLLQCRTTTSDVIFLMNPDLGLVENVSSFPKMTGALYTSETEYMLVFTGTEVPVPVEFVISRYTGRLTAVAEGTTVLFSGICRKGRARTLF